MFIRCMHRTILIVVFLCVIIVSTAAGLMGDECDWTGSGVSGRGVRPVYLRCSAGRIRWRYPRGALRVLVRAPQGARACVRVLRAARPPPALAEHAAALRGASGPVTWDEFPARVFVEGPGVLTPLFAPDDGLDSTVRCFRVRGGGGRAALYVEAAGTARAAALRYEVRAPRPAEHDPAGADCRPCDDAEATMAFCTADLVARGIINTIEERGDLETSQLTLKLTKLIRHITEDGRLYQEDSLGDPLVDETYEVIDSSNDLLYNDTALADRKKRSISAGKDLYTSIHLPSSCGAMPGEGEFMFMASRRLGYLALTCAPRIDQWETLMEKAKTEGTSHCLLSS